MSETDRTLPQRAPLKAESQVPPGGDQGDTSVLGDAHRTKSDLIMIRRAVRERWGVPAERKKKIVERVCDIATFADDDEVAISAARTAVTMDAADIQAMTAFDKMERLDSGEATERHEVTDSREAVRRIMENPKALRAALDAAKALDEAARDSGT